MDKVSQNCSSYPDLQHATRLEVGFSYLLQGLIAHDYFPSPLSVKYAWKCEIEFLEFSEFFLSTYRTCCIIDATGDLQM